MNAVALDAPVETDQRPIALAAGSLAVVAWGFGPLIVRGIGVSTPTVVFWRLWAAQPAMIAVAYLTGGRLSLAVLRRSLFPGVLFAASMFTSFASYQHTSIANATLIGALQPAVMLFVAPRLFGDRTSGRQRGLAAAALAGMAVVVLGAGATSGASWGGDLYAVANLTIWTVYFIRVKQVRDDGVHSASFLAGVFLVSALAITPWSLLTAHDLGSISGSGWLLVAVMVLGPGLLGHGSMTWAQRHLDITTASLLTLGHPVVATVAAWLIIGERLNGAQAAGAVVVILALALIVADSRSSAAGAATALPVAAD